MKKALNQFLTIAVFSIVLISCKKEKITMESNRLGKDSVLLNLQNNTPINQKVILFDTVNAFRSQNSLSNDTLYQWDFTGSLGTYNEAKVVATPSGGTATTYTYINQSGPISNVNDLVAGLNTLGIGTFYVLSGNIVAVNGGTDTYTYQSLDLLNAIQFNFGFTNLSIKTIELQGSGISGNIDWGDGNVELFVGSDLYTHTYTNAGNYIATVDYDGTLDQLGVRDNLTSFDLITLLPNSLQKLFLSGNNLTSFNPSGLPSSLLDLYLDNNNLTSFNPSVSLPNTLQVLNLSFNNLTSFNPSVSLPNTLIELKIINNSLNTSAINTTLVYLNNIGYSSPFDAEMPQTIPAPPSGAGITAKNDLISRGCSITTD